MPESHGTQSTAWITWNTDRFVGNTFLGLYRHFGNLVDPFVISYGSNYNCYFAFKTIRFHVTNLETDHKFSIILKKVK